MRKLLVFICAICVICGLSAETDQQQLARKRLKYIKYSTATYGYGNKIIAEKILPVANDEERKYYDEKVNGYKSTGSSDDNARANAINLLIEQMKKNDIKTLADLDQLENDINDLQNKKYKFKTSPTESIPVQAEPSVLAKAECSRLQSLYSSVKYDYEKANKAAHGKSDRIAQEERRVKGAQKVKDIEKKFDALPATTTEAKQLKAKLLKQLQLGRELKPDEIAALTKSAK